jgi:hypothetical protein
MTKFIDCRSWTTSWSSKMPPFVKQPRRGRRIRTHPPAVDSAEERAVALEALWEAA